ncbi:hypothetical protein G6F57_013201 [Rhizopus arrhizus]|nr:hypothetical protein G6F57_013201 [Rhizopus arrhizus]
MCPARPRTYSRNSQVAAGSTLFFDRGYVGVSIDAKDSEYGVPGFSMQNLSFGSNYADGLPVGVVIKQQRYALEALLRDPLPYFDRAELRVSKLDNTSGERLGASKANDYDFESIQAELLLRHQRVGPLSGILGLINQSRDVTGSGSLRYLPDVDTRSNAVFLKETLDFGWATFDAGVRHERVDHTLQPSRFKTARNAANTKLQDRDYRLNSYSLGSYVELGPLFAAKVRYSSSQRAPEINELYASNAHYSVMTQEEGNQNLEPERAKNLELTGLFHLGGFELSAPAYRMKYQNYLYLGYSGLQTANRLPQKYWKQTDTTVKGFEIDASQALDLGRYGTLNVSAFADLVKNKADHPDALRAHNDGEYLPNMPTNRYGANLQWQRQGWKAQLSSTYYGTQKYLGRNVSEEIPLDAFNLVDLQVSRELPQPAQRGSAPAQLAVEVHRPAAGTWLPGGCDGQALSPGGRRSGLRVDYLQAPGTATRRVASRTRVDPPSGEKEMAMNWKQVISLGVLLTITSGAGAASAITYDKDGRYGYSMNQHSLTTAMQQSLHYCALRSRNCGQSASTTSEGYSAIATGTVALGFALGEKTADAAQRKAERMCRERANDCTLALLWRETPPRDLEPPQRPAAAAPAPATTPAAVPAIRSDH